MLQLEWKLCDQYPSLDNGTALFYVYLQVDPPGKLVAGLSRAKVYQSRGNIRHSYDSAYGSRAGLTEIMKAPIQGFEL